MATEAQSNANRANARKSTGPRTPEGKGVVSQNAVKHGLLAREGVVRGEDWEEFQSHREMLMEQLNPAGALEVILAARIADLTWRLHRAAQDRNETFGALYDRHTAGAPEPAGPAERGTILGRMILEDYSGDAVLERLLRYERRIEGRLYEDTPEGSARETKPIGEGIIVQGSGGNSLTPETSPLVAELSCETKPISPGFVLGQVLRGTEVRDDSAQDGPTKTKPICLRPPWGRVVMAGNAVPAGP